MRLADIKEAAVILQAGGITIYQTETFCAIGCLGSNLAANEEICRLKGRTPDKPLPAIAAHIRQARKAAALDSAPQSLVTKFWPGPLSLLLPAKQGVAPQLINQDRKICLRVTSSNSAAALAKEAGEILSASSANFSGCPPAPTRARLDLDFLEACARCRLPIAILADDAPFKQAALPSTIAEPVKAENGWRLKIIRTGAVSASELDRIWK